MSLVTFFGTSSALNAGAGYSTTGTTGDTGIFGMRFKIFGETDTAAIGVRFYSAGTLAGAWAYLFDASEPGLRLHRRRLSAQRRLPVQGACLRRIHVGHPVG
jgi:hypothetical protein